MRVSVVIPCRDGTETGRLERLTQALAAQSLAPHEVIVSVDGDSTPMPADGLGGTRIIRGPRVGPGGARNRALSAVTGDLVLFLNDDVIPAPDLVSRHADEARRSLQRGRPAMILGLASWAIREPDRVIDRVLRESSLVFFYGAMTGRPADHDWGPRHAWTLNLSLPRSICERFDERLAYPMFDDLEWARRVSAVHGAPVLYRPDASVVHEHWYTPSDLLRREVLLGHQTRVLETIDGAFAGSMFGGSLVASRAALLERSLPAMVESGRQAYAQFEVAALRAAGDDGPRSVERLIDESRLWRDAARAWGFVAACRGDVFESAAASLPIGEPKRAGTAA